MKIVIIEDEKLTARDLAATIRAVAPEAEVLSLLHSVEDALAFFGMKPEVDLIFSDIELGDGLSFDIFQRINNQSPVIFCTAYEKYTLEAFQTFGIDYVLKPFNKAAIEKTLAKYQALKQHLSRPVTDFEFLLGALKNNFTQAMPSVIVHQGDKIIPVSGKDVALFYTDDDHSFAYAFDQKKYMISQKMETLEKLFAGSFFRANRQFLVNRQAIKDASHYFNRKLIINLSVPFPEPVVVGKLKATEFIKWLAAH
jgi:DNA-binding LytR/AlgR family response regulator